MQCIEYTILSTNYSEGIHAALSHDYIFRNSCRYDYGSELGSYHSNNDWTAYHDLVENYPAHPYGLKWMRCQIGLYNANNWRWMDGTAYDWGVLGTNTSKWDDNDWFEAVDCVLVENSFNSRTWKQYTCHSMAVHCGVCNTPQTRSYLFGMNATVTTNNNNTNTTNHIFLMLNGCDLFETNTSTIEWTLDIPVNTTLVDVETLFTHQTNLGQIQSAVVAVSYEMEMKIGMTTHKYPLTLNSIPPLNYY